jgi:hypothetical protein
LASTALRGHVVGLQHIAQPFSRWPTLYTSDRCPRSAPGWSDDGLAPLYALFDYAVVKAARRTAARPRRSSR